MKFDFEWWIYFIGFCLMIPIVGRAIWRAKNPKSPLAIPDQLPNQATRRKLNIVFAVLRFVPIGVFLIYLISSGAAKTFQPFLIEIWPWLMVFFIIVVLGSWFLISERKRSFQRYSADHRKLKDLICSIPAMDVKVQETAEALHGSFRYQSRLFRFHYAFFVRDDDSPDSETFRIDCSCTGDLILRFKGRAGDTFIGRGVEFLFSKPRGLKEIDAEVLAPYLENARIYTNKTESAMRLLRDDRAVVVIKEYVSFKPSLHVTFSTRLNIVEERIVLEFFLVGSGKKATDLLRDSESLCRHLEALVKLAERVELDK